MDEDSNDLSPLQSLITRVVAVASVNRWSFSIDFHPSGETTIRVDIPSPPADPGGENTDGGRPT